MKKYKIAGLILVLSSLVANIVYSQIDGKVGHSVDQAQRVQSAQIKASYESHEFVLAPAASDVDVKVTQTAFRAITDPAGGVPRAHTVTIRTDADITIKFNSVANDVISLSAAEGSMTWTVTEVTNIFLSSTPGANVKITLG